MERDIRAKDNPSKYYKRLLLFNEQIISMYLFGVTERDIKTYLERIYTVAVSPELISRVTDAVMEEVKKWQKRLLEKAMPSCILMRSG
ncbi:MAG: transposase [Spirochaetaceae bacterium]|jgi:transposase-like protein|nr:transposase [Spirochaetaceae bacterium]